MAEITVTGLEPILAKLDKLSNVRISENAMRAAVMHLHGKLSAYPGPRAGSSYIRTRRLGNSWTSRVSAGGSEGVVGTVVDYAPYVQGPPQRWFHRETGWKTVADVAASEADEVMAIVQAEIARALR